MTFEKFIVKFRLPIIIVFSLITLLLTFSLTQLEIEPNLNNLMPADMPSRVQTNYIDSTFGSNNLVIVILETPDILEPKTLKRVKELTHAFQRQSGIERVISLFTLKNIHYEDGAMIVNPAIGRMPRSKESTEALRKDLKNNTLINGTAISDDFTKAAILLTPQKDFDEIELLEHIQNILDDIPGEETVFIGGLPVVNATIMNDITKDVMYLLPIGLLLMIFMLFISFKQLRGILLPLGVVVMSIIVSFALMPILGWKITIVSILMPVILIAVANNYSIHIISRYNELLAINPTWTKKELTIGAIKKLKYPILATGLTTIVGILGLLVHIIVHARQLGVLTSIGIFWAILLSLLFVPAVLTYLPKKSKKKSPSNKLKKKRLLDHFLPRLSNVIVKHPKKIVFLFILLSLILSLGIFNLKIDGNMVNFFKKDHNIQRSSKLINDNFGGSQILSIMFEGDIKDPELLARMESYEMELLKNENVGQITSIVTALKEISKGLYPPEDPLYDRIPPSRDAIAQYLELYYMSGDPDDFEQMIDFTNEKAQIIVRINKADGYIIKSVVSQIEEMTRNDHEVTMLGGQALITSDMNLAIVNGQIKSLIFAIISIMIILMLVFRSIPAGIFAVLPLLLAEAILFGLMGYAGIRLDAATALLSSVMIGVGVDYTIHFLWRYRDEYKENHDAKESIRKALVGSGKGIIFNAFSVMMGFAALVFSSFIPIQYFGFLVVISIVVCLVAALILIPAMCIVFKPRFLEPKELL
ncbi:MAG: MMPL family transporter [Candidatus Neomarinimicrobiota bacterium]